MKKSCLLLVIFIYVFVNRLNAQAGYIINLKNDTVKCQVKSTLLGAVKYKANNTQGFKKVNADSIKEYRVTGDSAIYRSEYITDYKSSKFLKVLERGKINLYLESLALSGNTDTQNAIWYVRKGNDSLITLKSDKLLTYGKNHKDRKAVFMDLIADEPDTLAAFKAVNSFDFATIRAYVRRYNRK